MSFSQKKMTEILENVIEKNNVMFNVLDKSMFIETVDPHVDSRLRSLYLSEGYFIYLFNRSIYTLMHYYFLTVIGMYVPNYEPPFYCQIYSWSMYMTLLTHLKV